MHRYGDKDVDWCGIDDAAVYIGLFIRKWGRIQVRDMKEKYGTARVYCDNPVIVWQLFIYRLAYKKAIKKWPHLKQEILEGADWGEYLENL